MICCLNPDCQNPSYPDGTEFCHSCQTPLVVLRHYRPTKRLGSGGFGTTYLAEDVEKFNELCVIKQLAPQLQGTAALQTASRLFEQEAKRLQHLGEHPQIPTLLAYFEQDHRLYLVQQYIEGQNLLAELQQQGAFSEQKIRELMVDLLNILKCVHQQNVIHRDIKPENIIRRTPSTPPSQGGARGGQLVLIDFGASKQLTETVMSLRGTSIGSFGYVPIEQMEGGEAYPASDLYSVGATCFHLLTGVTPWELWKKYGYGWVDNWREHLRQPVSKKLGRILDKLLQADCSQRYQSVEEVLEDINRQPPPRVSPSSPTVPYEQKPSTSPPPSSSRTVPYERQASTSPPPASSPTVAYERQPSISPLPVSPSSPEPLASRRVASAKKYAKFKNPLLVGGAILLLAFGGGYGVLQIATHLPGNIAYEKLAVAKTLSEQADSVYAVAISPDGQTLVSGGKENTVKIWNLKTGELLNSPIGVGNGVLSLAISPDGQTLVSGNWDNSINIWNLQTGELKKTLTGHSYWVRSVAISPDGQTLASVSGDNSIGSGENTIKIWNLKTGRLRTTLSGHDDGVNCLAISPDGQTLVSGSGNDFYSIGDNSIKIWNLKKGELKTTLTGHTYAVKSVAISPDGQTLVSGSNDKTIRIWNLKTGETNKILTGHSNTVTSLVISPDGQTLISGSADNSIKIWNLKTGELKTTLTGHTAPVTSLAISPNGKTLVSGSEDKTVKIWRVSN